jgi:hypothetical protein
VGVHFRKVLQAFGGFVAEQLRALGDGFFFGAGCATSHDLWRRLYHMALSPIPWRTR